MQEKGKQPQHREHKLNHLKTRVALLVAVGLLGLLSACAPAIATSPTVAPSSTAGQITSIDTLTYNLNTHETSIGQSTQLQTAMMNGSIVAMQQPTLPCGSPPELSTPGPPTILQEDLKRQYCDDLFMIAQSFGVKPTQEQMDAIAKRVIFVSKEDLANNCDTNSAAACFLKGPMMTFLGTSATQATFLHELVHTLKLKGVYLSKDSGACYMINDNGNTVVIYPDTNSPTNSSKQIISEETAATVIEASRPVTENVDQVNFLPAYLQAGKPSEQLREAFAPISQQKIQPDDIEFFFDSKSVTIEEFIRLMEKLSGGGANYIKLNELFSKYLPSLSGFKFEYKLPVPSDKSPAAACANER